VPLSSFFTGVWPCTSTDAPVQNQKHPESIFLPVKLNHSGGLFVFRVSAVEFTNLKIIKTYLSFLSVSYGSVEI
jgi:hypothetical protein